VKSEVKSKDKPEVTGGFGAGSAVGSDRRVRLQIEGPTRRTAEFNRLVRFAGSGSSAYRRTSQRLNAAS
jgi:hypothetical protein